MRRFVPLRPKERGFAPESAQIAGFARGMRPHFLWERKWGVKAASLRTPPARLFALLSGNAQFRQDGFFPCAHLRLLGAFVQVVITQQVQHGMGH